MLTTSQLRSAWGPPCTGPWVRIALYGRGVVQVRAKIAEAVYGLSACLEAHRYQTRAADTGAYNCRRITGGRGYSLHAYGIAIDINWTTNPYTRGWHTDMPPSMVAAIKAVRTKNGKQVWGWGGDYRGSRDFMHYEIVCTPADIRTGINPATLPGHVVVPPASTAPEYLEADVFTAIQKSTGNCWLFEEKRRTLVPALELGGFKGVPTMGVVADSFFDVLVRDRDKYQ